jgi:hypothetical protein
MPPPDSPIPDLAELAPSRGLRMGLVLAVLLVNAVLFVFGYQTLSYDREMTILQVRQTTTNLATLLEHNQIGRAHV